MRSRRAGVTQRSTLAERLGEFGVRDPPGRRPIEARPCPPRLDRPATGRHVTSPAPSPGRLRPGQRDGLILDFVNSHGKNAAVGATAVAKAHHVEDRVVAGLTGG
jgi:hypothetical protein